MYLWRRMSRTQWPFFRLLYDRKVPAGSRRKRQKPWNVRAGTDVRNGGSCVNAAAGKTRMRPDGKKYRYEKDIRKVSAFSRRQIPSFFAARMPQKKEDHGLLIRLSVKDSGQKRIQKRIRERRI